MRVSKLDVDHFRNHTSTSVDLPPGVSVFVGANGQGKTNLVEAIGYLAYQTSHRVSSDKALVQHGEDQAVVRARVEYDGREADVACEINSSGANRARVNSQPIPLGQLSGWLKAVLFTPEDLALVRGEPAVRRRYIDQTMVVLRPALQAVVSDYERVVKQRNALLKSHRGRPTPELNATLVGWNERLVSLAIDYTAARRDVLQLLSVATNEVYEVIAPSHLVALSIQPSTADCLPNDTAELNQWYRHQLDDLRRDEWERGMTLVGPHRDDLLIELNGLPARTHSSQGEAWSLALALRMAQALVYRAESTSGDPVIILDDVFAELDRSRRATLESLVDDYEQVLVTAAVWDDIPQRLRDNVFDVEAGQVCWRGH